MIKSLKSFAPYYRFLKPVKWHFATGLFLGVVYAASTGLGLPVMVQTVLPILFEKDFEKAPPFIRGVVEFFFGPEPGSKFLIVVSLFLPLAMLLRAIGSIGNGYFMTHVGLHVVQALQFEVFERVQKQQLGFFSRFKSGDLMIRIMSFPDQIRKIVVEMSNDLIKQPLTLLSAVSFLVWKSLTNTSFLMAIVGAISVPLVVLPIRHVGKYLAKRSKQLASLGAELNSSTLENIQNPVEVRAFALEERHLERFRTKLREVFRASLKSVRTSLTLSPSIEVIASLGLALSLYLGVSNGMQKEEFLALFTALYLSYEPIKKLGKIHGQLRAAEAPLARMEQVLKSELTVKESASPKKFARATGAVEFRNVSFCYPSQENVEENSEKVYAVKDYNLSIHPGERVVLMGPSGSGKSTLMALLQRFYDVGEGAVLVDGIDIRELSFADLRRQFALVPQMPALFGASIRENIRLGKPDASDAEVEEAAKHAYAHDFILKQEKGYETRVGERGTTLSGGQRQRIAIARAFLKDAPILLLDEATSALDKESEELVMLALDKLSSGRTTISITHSEETYQFFEKKVILSL